MSYLSERCTSWFRKLDQDVDRTPTGTRDRVARRVDQALEQSAGGRRARSTARAPGLGILVVDRVLLGVLFEEEVERVDRHEIRDEAHLDAKLVRRFLEDVPRQVVAERVLLPVDEVVTGRNPEGVRLDGRPAVGRRAKARTTWGENRTGRSYAYSVT